MFFKESLTEWFFVEPNMGFLTFYAPLKVLLKNVTVKN